MIAKMIFKSKRFLGFKSGFKDRRGVYNVVNYITRDGTAHEEGLMICNDFAQRDASSIADEVEALSRGHKYRGYHFVISFPAKERFRWMPHCKDMTADFKKRFKVSKQIWCLHLDKKDDDGEVMAHMHGFIFGDDAQGKALKLQGPPKVAGGKPQMVSQALRTMCVEWEDKVGGQKTGRGIPSPSIKKNAHVMAHRTGLLPDVVVLRADLAATYQACKNVDEFKTAAEAKGIQVKFFEKDGKRTGWSFARGKVYQSGAQAGLNFNTIYDNQRHENTSRITGPAQRTKQVDRSVDPATTRSPKADDGYYREVAEFKKSLKAACGTGLLGTIIQMIIANYDILQRQSLPEYGYAPETLRPPLK